MNLCLDVEVEICQEKKIKEFLFKINNQESLTNLLYQKI